MPDRRRARKSLLTLALQAYVGERRQQQRRIATLEVALRAAIRKVATYEPDFRKTAEGVLALVQDDDFE